MVWDHECYFIGVFQRSLQLRDDFEARRETIFFRSEYKIALKQRNLNVADRGIIFGDASIG